MRTCGLEPLLFNWFQAARQLHISLRLFDYLTQSKSSAAEKILQADVQMSSECNNCWISLVLSAMDVLTKSYEFKERLLKCEPINLSRFVVDLREKHWAPYASVHPRERNSKRSTYHRWCALPAK